MLASDHCDGASVLAGCSASPGADVEGVTAGPSAGCSPLDLPAARLPDKTCLTSAVWQHCQPGAASKGSVSLLNPMSPLQGDNNHGDDRSLYAPGQNWLNQKHIMGRVVG